MSVRETHYPAIANAPLVGLAEGNGTFSNLQLALVVLGVPYVLKTVLPIVSRGGFKTYVFLLVLTGVPSAVGYWTAMSIYGPRKNEKVRLPGKDIEEYITINDPELKARYHGKEKIPMQVFHDAYFEGKIDIKGTVFTIVLKI
jgi:sphingolipid C9-methyltransferase